MLTVVYSTIMGDLQKVMYYNDEIMTGRTLALISFMPCLKMFIHLTGIVHRLTELYLSGNEYTDFSLNIPPYNSLKRLQLTSNKLSNWSDVAHIGQCFPHLEYLVIANNAIEGCGKFFSRHF